MKNQNNKNNQYISKAELARRADVNIESIRFYERKKLIIIPKNVINKGKYTPEYVEQVKFIKKAQKVGFSLNEIKELLELKLTKKSDCLAIKKITEKKAEEVEERIKSLKKILKLLKAFEKQCNGLEGTERCTILDNLKGIEI